jgi:hypothetical protein
MDSDINTMINRANIQMHNVSCFFRINKLSLHPLKTKFILFTNSSKVKEGEYKIYIDNNDIPMLDASKMSEIKRVSTSTEEKSVRFLGLYVDPDLKYFDHIQKMRRKISSGLYFIKKAKNFIGSRGLKSLYYSLVHSHIIYGIHVWSTAPQYMIDSIFKLQKRAIRLVSGSRYNAHTETLFKNHKILPLPNLIKYFQLQFMNQFCNSFLPLAFDNTWINRNEFRNRTNPENEGYYLRNGDDLYLPQSRLISTEKAPFYSFPRIWQNFENMEIKIQRNKNIFNSMLKKHLLDNLSSDFKCNRLLCSECNLNLTQLSSEEED